MSQPEIFRRCSECGASFSSADLFCPGCGVPTVKNPTETEPNTEQQSLPVEANKQTVPLKPDVAATVAPLNSGKTLGRAKPSVIVRDKRERKLTAPVGKLRKGTTM